MNALFVANKPIAISSNHFLGRLKRKYSTKKAGFSGTLDPFASGCLIVALGNYTRLFNYISKSPKIYEATMWIGAKSKSGDNENISEIEILNPLDLNTIKLAKKSLLGKISYTPPKFSAKNIDGTRAYKLARAGVEFELKKEEMEVFSCEIMHYFHPFLTFKISVDEGSYIRSYTQILAKKLGVNATLSSLKRLSEGKFKFEKEKFLNPLDFIDLETNEYLGDFKDILFGKKLEYTSFKKREDGIYLIKFDKFFSIIEIKDQTVSYRLNKVELC
ncbi:MULTISPECIES: tRNA pseudouridine(55) synthase TruB [unclassified Campylobacter]|uniref:tRNA pseudouridine(55) synthase TruB n=1 Tax=unclassified Campylobacter TaxID=2593542 RepID=UPI0014743BB4|nr:MULTISPECIES: tRNA pseudouridine(55) synthase TruB [unclassified Campylobacter]